VARRRRGREEEKVKSEECRRRNTSSFINASVTCGFPDGEPGLQREGWDEIRWRASGESPGGGTEGALSGAEGRRREALGTRRMSRKSSRTKAMS
jgi:hypothetical protein